ncbi:MAG: radical SAM/SPASM domain-containing protein [Anaerolineales bacterium]
MNRILDRITSLFKPAVSIPAGLYHYQSPPQEVPPYRMHLRVNEDGSGLLIINASTILHLNQTATEYVYHLIQGTSEEDTSSIIASRYLISRDQARTDFLDTKDRILSLLKIPDLDPVSFLEFSREDPYTGTFNAPYRLDCALTYRLPEGSNPQFAPTKRVDKELTTEEWFRVVDRAWELGIPHLIFTGGEPTLRDDLVQIVNKAEDNGQVTGLLSDGLKFSDANYRQEILQSGLDHLLFLLSDDLDISWKALEAILNEDLFTTVHITINPRNSSQLRDIIVRCQELGANAISLSTTDPDDDALGQALLDAQTLVAEADLPLKWDLPVPYSAHNPIAIELKKNQEAPHGTGKAWFYIEPDGDVLPGQGINHVLGNMLDDDWDQIWSQQKADQ